MIRTEDLAEFLVTNNFLFELEHRDYYAIFERFIDDHPDPDGDLISMKQLKSAVALARKDPAIQKAIRKK
ncbi:hypothetical protein AB5J52_06855 [Streptomyces sp. R39]|uniref:Uncharacterized protein n=1 Tax=Streptomyces sp. R39 TaxID=3238631 RepID=A0AB39QHP4_9ACTN